MIHALISRQRLRPADVIVVNSHNMGLLNLADHYLVYLGQGRRGCHWFMANLKGSVKRLSEWDIQRLASGFSIDRIRYFSGTEYQRRIAIQRACDLEGYPYDLLTFNCEHFANYVQYGKSFSKQVRRVRNTGLVIAGLLLLGSLGGRK